MRGLPWSRFGIARDIVLTSGARIYSALVAMAVLALSAHWLGPEGRGVVVIISTWVGLFATVGYLSLGQVCMHRASNSEDMDWIGPVFSALLMITVAVSAAGWLIAGVLFHLAHRQLFNEVPFSAFALGFLALPFFVWEQYGSVLLTIVGRIGSYNLNQIVSRTIGLILMGLAVAWLNLGVMGFLAVFVVTQAMIAGAGIQILRRQMGGHPAGGLGVIAGLVRDGLKLHLNSIGVLLFSGVDILLLNFFRGPAETAIFQLPMQLFIAILMVPQSALLVLNSRVSALSPADFWRLQWRVILGVVGALAAATPLLWVLAPWFISMLGGDRFFGSIDVIRILLIGVAGAAFNTLMGIQWIVRGYFYRASFITLGTGVANVLLNLILIPKFGAIGAAAATVAGLYLVPVSANLFLAFIAERDARNEEAHV